MNSWDLAHIITHFVNQKGDSVSHKKLQKLLYYVEAWHLVNFDAELLEDNFEAWIHGPVLPELYQKLKVYGFNNLKVINEEHDNIDDEILAIIKRNSLTEGQMELIEGVLDRYGSLTSFELELLSHSEAPWIEARNNIPPHESCRNVIKKERIKEFYSSISK